jgi:CDGSH-type Zn-finger protein
LLREVSIYTWQNNYRNHHTLAAILANYFFYKDSYFCIDNTCDLYSSLFITMYGQTMLLRLLFLVSLVNFTYHTILVLDDNFQNSKDERLSNIVGIALRRCGWSKNQPFCDGSHNKINFENEKDWTWQDKKDLSITKQLNTLLYAWTIFICGFT